MEIIESTKEQQIIETILNILKTKHPIVENRLETLLSSESRFDICLYFGIGENQSCTLVKFLDGTEGYRSTIPEKFFIKGDINPDFLNELIFNILLDHDCIKNSWTNFSEIGFEFIADLRENNLNGIDCCTISLTLDFHSLPYHEVITKYFANSIFDVYNIELDNKQLGEQVKLMRSKS